MNLLGLRSIGMALIAVCPALCASAAVSSQSYVNDGHLVFQLDGEANVSAGTPQSDSATTWANLVGEGGGELSGTCTWEQKGLYLESASGSSKGLVTIEGLALNAAHTIEMCALVRKCNLPARFFGLDGASDFPGVYNYGSGYPNGKLGMMGYGLNGIQMSASTFPLDAGVTITISQDGVTKTEGLLCYTNGAELVRYTIKSTYSTAGTTIYLGNNKGLSRGSDIVIYSFRVYDCVLTPEQVALNARIDRARFFGGSMEGLSDMLTVSGDPFAIGQPVPSYGDLSVDRGNVVNFSIADSLEVFPDGVRAIAIGEGSRARLVGCTVVDEVSGTNTYAAESFAHTIAGQNTTATWQFAGLQHLVGVSAEGGATFLVNGVAAGADSNLWLAAGTSVSLTVVPQDGYVFRGWLGDVDGIADTGAMTISAVADRPRQLSVAIASAALDTSDCYVQDGLIVHYDAIDNAGRGTHRSDATVWTDLSGHGVDGVLSGAYAWKESALSLRSVSENGVVRFTPTMTATHTVEVRAKFDQQNGTGAGRYCDGSSFPGIYNRFGSLDSSIFGVIGYWGASGVLADASGTDRRFRARDENSLAISHAGIVGEPVISYLNGNLYGQSEPANNICAGSATAFLGNSSAMTRGVDGDFCALRVYNRLLTPAEIKWNNAVDRVRYGGVSTNDIYGKVEVFMSNEPADLAYGDVLYGGENTIDVGVETEFSIRDRVIMRRFDGALVMAVVSDMYHDVYVGYEYSIDDAAKTSGRGTAPSFRVLVENDQMSPCLAITVKWFFRREPIKRPGLLFIVR